MLRVRLFAVAMIALGAALAGCSSSGSTSDMFKSSAASPSHPVSIRAGRRERSDRTRPNLFDAVLACRAGDRPGGFVQPEWLRATNDSARGSPGGRLLVQQAAAGSCPQSGCRGTPGASAPGSAPAQGEAEAAHCGRYDPGLRRRGRHRRRGRQSLRLPPRSKRRRKTMCSRLRHQRRHRRSRRRRRRDNAGESAASPAFSGKIMDDQGFIRHIGLTIS